MIDFGKTTADYARFRVGFPDELVARLLSFGIGHTDQKILDLGTGTGSLARLFARRGANVTALDISIDMIAAARTLDKEEDVTIQYLEANAERTGLTDASFDVITAGQCWHWFDAPKTTAEAMRLLSPGGKLVIAQFDWLPVANSVVEATEELIRRHNQDWALAGGTGIHPGFLGDLQTAGFTEIESFSFDIDIPYSHEAWRGRIRASAGVAASLSPDNVAEFDAEHKLLLKERFPDDPLVTPHRVFVAIGRRE